MTDSKFDFSKLKDKAGGLMGSFKSMINPAGGTPAVDPSDALGLKIAEMTTLIKQLADTQQEHVKQLHKLNELMNAVFHDVEVLRNQAKTAKPVESKTDQ